MNDRYLYRAKRKNWRELPKEMWWVEGYLYGIWERRYILWGMTNNVPNMVEVNPSTICQCTGLKDKNGKLIWENDVVKYQDTIGIVNWNKTHLAYTILKKNKDGNMQYYYMDEELGENIEVIGNTFDNPEMLEVEE